MPVPAGPRVYMRQAEVAARTWASEARVPRGAAVFFLLPEDVGGVPAPVARRALRLSGDIDVRYEHQTVRDLILWHYLAANPTEPNCEWYLRSDGDTYVNLSRLLQRLACFKPWQPHHVGWPKTAWSQLGRFREANMRLYLFGNVVLNRNLLSRMDRQQGFIACLDALLHDWAGQGMMDVILSDCIFKTLVIWPEFLGDDAEIVGYPFKSRGR
ncbi:unnamed protein product [Prorocentrum cordatum]|uniref:Fringe-like glycosyltransferase domain-containing protein n=1 Tax=Prorocentrum cordatum TaxID=2364126 RepID=A0ABN9QFQ6_9DINO|nr:unnamed protein product [Polarella glacialis]